ncbi:MAG: IreB family regulatory phosphoprotein [Erysipelotrichaceae bacterium]|jgi:uncharacterized protein (UPF0297 family)|nr:IreB family regulatory phosphoprotein [Erysipelotrichaceae bacterium]
MEKDLTEETKSFSADELAHDTISRILHLAQDALTERGYNAVNQLVGYLISNDPAYISSYKNARSIIQTVTRDEIIEELVRFYLSYPDSQ